MIEIIDIHNENQIHHHYDNDLSQYDLFLTVYTGNSNNCTVVHDSSIDPLKGLMYWRQSNQPILVCNFEGLN